MGITGLFPLIEAHVKPATIAVKDLKGRSVAVDVSWLIHMYVRAGTKTTMLSDSDNPAKPTIHLLQIINLAFAMKTAGVKGMVFVFDHPGSNPLKAEENAKRHLAREKAAAAAADDEKETATGAFRITEEITADCMFLIGSLGLPYIVAGEGFEAEQVCAMLTQKGIADVVLTNDSDALTFGATAVARKNLSKSTYSLHSLPAILAGLGLSHADFVKVCVLLGCDFAKKTKGIGTKTVLKKYKAVELTEEQQKAYNYFMAECPFSVEMIIRREANVAELSEWLQKKGFNARMSLKLEVIALREARS